MWLGVLASARCLGLARVLKGDASINIYCDDDGMTKVCVRGSKGKVSASLSEPRGLAEDVLP